MGGMNNSQFHINQTYDSAGSGYDESRLLAIQRKAKDVEIADVRAVVKKKLKDQMNE